MEKATVSKTFSPKKYKDSELSNKAEHVLEKMTNNPNFPNPTPSLATLKLHNENYYEALLKSQKGSMYDTSVKKENRKILETSLNELAEYVQLTCRGDEIMILSSGFNVNRKPALVGQLQKVQNLTVNPGNNYGSVLLSCNVVPHTKIYVFEYCLAPVNTESRWVQVMSSKRKVYIEGLERGKEYAFRATAVGTHPKLVWSEMVLSYVI
jgi:hypothetical protein